MPHRLISKYAFFRFFLFWLLLLYYYWYGTESAVHSLFHFHESWKAHTNTWIIQCTLRSRACLEAEAEERKGKKMREMFNIEYVWLATLSIELQSLYTSAKSHSTIVCLERNESSFWKNCPTRNGNHVNRQNSSKNNI